MINIKQLSTINVQLWPHRIYMGYMTEVMRRIGLEWDSENPCPAKLQPYLTALQTAHHKWDVDYQMSQKSELTALIDKADKERDAPLNQVLTMVQAMRKMDGLPAKKQAAEAMAGALEFYKLSASMALRDETTQVQQWHQVFQADPAQVAAAAELGLTDIIAQLMAKNTEVETLMAQRSDETHAKAEVQLSEDRKAVDEAMRDFTMMLDALALTDNDTTRFDAIITGLTNTQDDYQQRYEDNRRANKRVSVKSTVVGNHLYQTSREWTWERLIEDGKALLAIDRDDPTRIISTDKKAAKAGGLCLALKGVPVKPTDDVDVTKEYELIPAE